MYVNPIAAFSYFAWMVANGACQMLAGQKERGGRGRGSQVLDDASILKTASKSGKRRGWGSEKAREEGRGEEEGEGGRGRERGRKREREKEEEEGMKKRERQKEREREGEGEERRERAK
jgi:hypothetical protein